MSAWPEAVWIVKKIQQNFNFEEIINSYTDTVQQVNGNINNLIDKTEGLEQRFNEEIVHKTMTYRETSTSNIPSEEVVEGVICLIISNQEE